MSEQPKSKKPGRKRDWRIWLGIIVTAFWLGGGAIYVTRVVSSGDANVLSPEAIGSFLEGAFAPLAFLWLVIGLFIQQQELANNSKAIRKASKQSEKQTAAIAATEMNARQETFFKIKENVNHQLGSISGMLFASSVGPVGNGEMSREEMDEAFKRVGDGDYEVFARMFLSRGILDGYDLQGMFFGTEIRITHAKNYMRTFDRLRRLARNCDVDGIIYDSMTNTAFGLLYRRMQEHLPAETSGAESDD